MSRTRPTPKTCPLRNEWRSWDRNKQMDRVFMVCPGCGTSGSHVNLSENRG